jgi:hypothetical protein
MLALGRPVSAAHLILILVEGVLAFTVCPGGWSHWDVGDKCYKLTAGRFNALGCATACGPNATLACISSRAEADFVATLTHSLDAVRIGYVWMGLHQSRGSAEPRGGWDTCASGERPNFTNWHEGQPDNVKNFFNQGGVLRWPTNAQCAVIGHPCYACTFDVWYDHPCYPSYPCVCELGAPATPEYLSSVGADIEEGLQQLRKGVAILYGAIIPALWLLPTSLRVCFHLASSLRRRPKETYEPPASSSNIIAHASLKKLADAEAKGKRLRRRVSGTVAQLGWMLIVLGFAQPAFMIYIIDLTTVAGASMCYLAALPWGFAIGGLALRPIDARAIRIWCAVGFFICFVLGLFCAWLTLQDNAFASDIQPIITAGLAGLAIICAICTLILWPTLNIRFLCRAVKVKAFERAPSSLMMSPRRQLRRVWLVLRLFFTGWALIFLAFFISTLLYVPIDPSGPAPLELWILLCASFLAASLVFTPANRGRVVAWLGTLGKTDEAENEAAALAALVNTEARQQRGALQHLSATEAFKLGIENFRKLDLDQLTEEEIAGRKVGTVAGDWKTSPGWPTRELYNKTSQAEFGQVDAFVSHSWSDDGDAKYVRMKEWAAGREVSIWLDKACLDQRDITASLAGLPVFLAGCKKLLVLAGPTYASRLWCVMEIFVFVRMGGKQSDMVVRLLSGATNLAPALLKFDAGKAKTFDPNDKERLWAVIEAAFGTFHPFNKIVREVFNKELQRGRSSHFKVRHDGDGGEGVGDGGGGEGGDGDGGGKGGGEGELENDTSSLSA